ncbi:130_t:CDS:2, partial [Racocetra fulgida]
ITDQLDLKINKDGSTEPFVSKLPDINLNCDKMVSYNNTTYSKRTEDDYYKDPYRKRAQGSQIYIYEDSSTYDEAD